MPSAAFDNADRYPDHDGRGFLWTGKMRMLSRLAVMALLFLPLLAGASSIRRMDMDEIASRAELVFEGRVIARRVVHVPNSRTLRTEVTFEVDEVIKGNLDSNRVTLSFLGGVADGVALRVSDLLIPELGEQGIYFVESLSRPLVNPLVGWHQGHYLIDHEQGTDRAMVRTRDGKPIFGLEPARGYGISRGGGAAGVEVRPRKPLEMPMTPDDFKGRIRGMLR